MCYGTDYGHVYSKPLAEKLKGATPAEAEIALREAGEFDAYTEKRLRSKTGGSLPSEIAAAERAVQEEKDALKLEGANLGDGPERIPATDAMRRLDHLADVVAADTSHVDTERGDTTTQTIEEGVSIKLTPEQLAAVEKIYNNSSELMQVVMEIGRKQIDLQKSVWDNIAAWYPDTKKFNCALNVVDGEVIVNEPIGITDERHLNFSRQPAPFGEVEIHPLGGKRRPSSFVDILRAAIEGN